MNGAEGDDCFFLEKEELPGGVWRLIPQRPCHDLNRPLYRHVPNPLLSVHQATPRGMYPEIDMEIDRIMKAAAEYQKLKQAKALGEKLITSDIGTLVAPSCLASLSAQRIHDQMGSPMEMIPDRQDWRKKCSFDETAIKILLANDWDCRKAVRWELVPYEEFGQFESEAIPFHPRHYSIPRANDNMYHVDMPEESRPSAEDEKLYIIRQFNKREAPINLLYQRFPFLVHLFSKYTGCLAAAGGALTRLFCKESPARGSGKPADVDLFFYGLIGKRSTEAGVREAEARAALILKDCIAMLCVLSPAYFRVENKEYVTNVFVVHPDPRFDDGHDSRPVCYQFIKRIYPTKDSSIGGFDLGPSSLLYDGSNIYGTELGAWSIVKSTLVIDTSRRSLTFEKRIHKLWRLGFAIVFPGIRQSTIQTILNDPDFDRKDAISKIVTLFRSLGVAPTNRGKDDESFGMAVENMLDDEFTRCLPPIEISGIRLLADKRVFSAGGKSFVANEPFDAAHWAARTSDYNDQYVADFRIDAVASSSLRWNNLDAVFTYFIRDYDTVWKGLISPMRYEDAYAAFEDLINNPKVVYDPFYRNRVEWLLTCHSSQDIQMNHWGAYFAEFAPRVRAIFADGAAKDDGYLFISRVVTVLEERMIANVPKCEQRLKGLKWITQEPGRQWTSSIKPIRESPVDFYGVKYYTPFSIGMPVEVETTLRLIWHQGQKSGNNNQLAALPRDIFRMLMRYLWRSHVYNTMTKTVAQICQLPQVQPGAPPQQFMHIPPGFQVPQFGPQYPVMQPH